MDIQSVAPVLKELGSTVRLTIYMQVVRAGRQGVPVGDIQQAISIPNSTLSHHISGLVKSGLISQRREGRVLYCVAEYQQLDSVISFLTENCCIDESRYHSSN